MTLEVTLTHRFPGFTLDLAFEAPAGVTALFGRSGSGKSTVVNAVAGLLRPDRGRIACGGRLVLDTEAGVNLPPHRRRLGYVFQDGRLFPHLTVRQNLSYGRWFAPRGASGASFDHVVALLGITPLLNRRPATLSGGEKARVAIGRALLSAPEILLLDEPLAALDAPRKAEILPYLDRLAAESGIPILYVSHSIAEVARLATTLVVLDQGRILRRGPVGAVLADPALGALLDPREAGSILPATVAGPDEDGLTRLETGAGPIWLSRIAAAPGTPLRLRIGAQDVILARDRPEAISALNILPARVLGLTPDTAGGGVSVQIDIGGAPLLVRVTARSVARLDLRAGAEVFAIVKSVAVAEAGLPPG